MYIHSDGFKFIIPLVFLSFLGLYLSPIVGSLVTALTIWVAAFFRNPKPKIPTTPNAFISPASGKVVAVKEVIAPEEYMLSKEPVTRISIFLNIFDIHMNRIPCFGKIKKIIYSPGKFVNAAFDKASEDNERNTIILENNNRLFAITQIAGLIARRIRCDIHEGDVVHKGQFYGLIRFGSRVDIYFDRIIQANVKVGDRVSCGESILSIIEDLKEQ